jgi:dephospho-CoA kinase
VPARIVLCGGIGSGKSTVALLFGDHGAHVISADDVARRVLDPETPEHKAVIDRWPEVAVDGIIDRPSLGRIVFADPDALSWVESLTHPATKAAIESEVAAHADVDVVVEIPILREWFEGWITVVVDAPEETRVARASARSDAITPEDVRMVMARQPSRSEWLMAADLVIDNRGDLEHLHSQFAAVRSALGRD